MAGSIKTFKYVPDAPNVGPCVYNADESNGESIGNTDLDDPTRGTSLPGIPSGIEPRYAVYQGDGHTRRIIVSTVAALASLPASISAANPLPGGPAITLVLARAVSEFCRVYTGTDTGLTDGDLT